MKPPAFDYVVASSIDEACSLLEADEDAKVIAGGQSLVPLLNLRFANPSVLVDIGRISSLRGIRRRGDAVVIGAMTRHVEIETNGAIAASAPLLAEAAGWVAHPQIRNRGTFGGAIAHSDSAAEFPAVLLAMEATIVMTSPSGERRAAARDFFGPYFQTSLRQGEIVTAVEVPAADESTRWGFFEFARRKGDYAIGGAAVHARVDPDGTCVAVNGGLISAGPGPTAADELSSELIGRRVNRQDIESAVERVAATLMPEVNVHGSREYRRAVVAESLRRALSQSFDLPDPKIARRTA
ncbi:xanthine dehydrogenase family protein subunit M [Nocardioides sp. CN2-186]|uniref:FAD binding domain-containing protein n=1 Tax=Nocardioides tweenelious TaxID=3156607 RepID=UPI0032B4F70F